MRAWVMSDLHTETSFFSLPPTPPDVDVIVIAGDVADGHFAASRWLATQAVVRGLPVIFTPGNHEFYGHDLSDEMVDLYESDGVILLHAGRPSVTVKDTLFVGSTLWTDYKVANDEAAARSWARMTMPDLYNIDVGMRRAGTKDFSAAFAAQLQAITHALEQRDPATAAIVVTHHAPHLRSLRSALFLDASDGSYASDLSDLIERTEPAVWVHGHVHHARDYYAGATRIVCNPRGYVQRTLFGPAAEHKSFQRDLVVEI